MVSQIASLEHIEVGSEIEALLLESKLIKKFKPHYNLISKDDKSPYYIHITPDKFPKPVINHISPDAIAGPFLTGFIARQILKSFRKVTPYHSESPCFYRHLGLCSPCPDDPKTTRKDYLKNISKLKQLLRGQFKQVMSAAVKSQDFEAAAALRNLIYQPTPPEEYVTNPNLQADLRQEALDSLRLSMNYEPITNNSLHRIECFDVANLSGSSATAAMTVAIDGEVTSKNYRHFTIHSPGPNDVVMLSEALTRRLRRNDWPKPDLIVLDGGKSQLSIVAWDIPTIGLAKKEEVIYTSDGREIKLDNRHPGLQLLQRLRDEAHRFSRRLHHKHRSVIIKIHA